MITILIPENGRFYGELRKKRGKKEERFPNLLIKAKAKC